MCHQQLLTGLQNWYFILLSSDLENCTSFTLVFTSYLLACRMASKHYKSSCSSVSSIKSSRRPVAWATDPLEWHGNPINVSKRKRLLSWVREFLSFPIFSGPLIRHAVLWNSSVTRASAVLSLRDAMYTTVCTTCSCQLYQLGTRKEEGTSSIRWIEPPAQ